LNPETGPGPPTLTETRSFPSPALATRQLPRTGQVLTTLGMGCAPLGSWYKRVSDADARAAVDAAWNAGVRLFDTAPFYGYTLSEHRLGEAMRDRPRDAWVLSTKVGRMMRPLKALRAPGAPLVNDWIDPLPFEPVFDYSAAAMRRSIEDSLQRLGVQHIDIALIHDIGVFTHAELQAHYWAQLTTGGGFREMEVMRRERLIGAIGLGVNEWQVILDAMQHTDLDCCLLAGRYTLLEQGSLSPFLDECVKRQVGVIVGGPFNSGVLVSGPVKGALFNYAVADDSVLARASRLQQVCAEFGVPLAAAALQFPLAHPAVVSCIPGARDAAELQQIAAWLRHEIPDGLWTTLRERGLIDPAAPLPTEAR
jgi:D-threo-aldose 1-dehydrogenase